MIVDVHNHYLPEKIARAYGAEPGKPVTVMENGVPKRMVSDREYIVEERLRAMDKAGISIQLMSVPVGWNAPPDECRYVNDCLAETQTHYHDRLRGLASIPIGHDEGKIISELHRAVDQLRLKGIAIAAQPGGLYLDDRKLWPIYKEIEKMKLGVFIHPSPLPQGFKAVEGYDFLRVIGREFDLVTAVCRVIYGKVIDTFPDLKLVFSHFGGGLAILVERVDPKYKPWYKMRQLPRDFEEYLGKLFFDTAGFAGGMRAFRAGLEVLGADHLLFGSDYPQDFIEGEQIKTYVDHLKAYLAPEPYKKIMGGNAQEIFQLGNGT